jgi:hypothetical protein
MLFIVGDSHTLRLRNSAEKFQDNKYIPSKYCDWTSTDYLTVNQNKNHPGAGTQIKVSSQCKSSHLSMYKTNNKKIAFSGHPGGTGYSSTYSQGEYPCIKKIIDKNSIIMPFFGYIDVKAHLPHTHNTEEAVIRYIERTVKFFDNDKNIKFLEPMPQFVNALGGGYPNYEFDIRFKYYEEYKYYLRKYIKHYKLESPISTEDIFQTDRFDESYECHDCIDCLRPQFIDKKLDHLKPEFNKTILNHIVKNFL